MNKQLYYYDWVRLEHGAIMYDDLHYNFANGFMKEQDLTVYKTKEEYENVLKRLEHISNTFKYLRDLDPAGDING